MLSKFLEYMPSLDGVLLNTEDCKDIQVISKATKFFMVSVKADCYVFSPAVGTKLNIEINKVGENYANITALSTKAITPESAVKHMRMGTPSWSLESPRCCSVSFYIKQGIKHPDQIEQERHSQVRDQCFQ